MSDSQERLHRLPRKDRTRRWPVPAIAAAAVVAIALVTSAVATHGFGIGASTAAGGGSAPVTASWGCPLRGGETVGASDTGFNAGGIEFSAETSGSVVCFFDGVSTWNLPLGTGPLAVDITDVGTFIPMAAGAKATKGRIVWGVPGDSVTAIRVAAGTSAPQSEPIGHLTSQARAFYAQVPATGRVTVTAENGDGTVVATRTFD